MTNEFADQNKKTEKLVFILSLVTSTFWGIGQVMDVYHYPVVGAIYELFWLPFLILVFGIPLASIFFWAKTKFKIRTLLLPTIIISFILLAGMILR